MDLCDGSPISPIGLGTGQLCSANGGLDPDAARALIHRALEYGINCFDTANVYGQGDAERALGAVISQDRSAVFIATKVGYSMPSGSAAIRRIKPLVRAATSLAPVRRLISTVRSKGQDRATGSAGLRSSVHQSMERLQSDYVDLLHLHSPGSPGESASSDTLLDLLSWAKREGLCRLVGVAVPSADEAMAWAATGAIDAIQLPVGLEELAAVGLLRSRSDVSLIAREVFSGGRLFDPSWRSKALASARDNVDGLAVPSNLGALDYLSWLTTSGLVESTLIGSRDAGHIADASRAVGLRSRSDG